MAEPAVIPLFPLKIVLLPGMSLPLHIFEERYKTMIGDCLQSAGEFGVVLAEGKRLREVGCSAAIRRVLRRYPDGRLDLLTAGTHRFRILEVREGKTYLEAETEPLHDEAESSEESARLAAHGTALLVQLAGMIGRPADLPDLRRLSVEDLSFRLAAVEGFSLDERQRLLETTRTRERLERATEGLELVLEQLRKEAEARRLTGGNGHAREGFQR